MFGEHDQLKRLAEELRVAANRDAFERAKRYLEVVPHNIVPDSHFADISVECARLHRDGHFYGSIALCQAVGEAIVRRIRERTGVPQGELESVVRALAENQIIPSSVCEDLLELWRRRNDYHHLNPSIETDCGELEALSRRKNQLLKSIETEMFGYDVEDGCLKLRYPSLWNVQGDRTSVFLRFDNPR
jgi:hypothetical protein